MAESISYVPSGRPVSGGTASLYTVSPVGNHKWREAITVYPNQLNTLMGLIELEPANQKACALPSGA